MTEVPTVEDLLEQKNWTGLTLRDLAKAGRIGNPEEKAKEVAIATISMVAEGLDPSFSTPSDYVECLKKTDQLADELAVELKLLNQ